MLSSYDKYDDILYMIIHVYKFIYRTVSSV